MSAALVLAMFASACRSGPATDFCAVSAPIFIARADQLTDDTARQVLAHNETWAALCPKAKAP